MLRSSLIFKIILIIACLLSASAIAQASTSNTMDPKAASKPQLPKSNDPVSTQPSTGETAKPSTEDTPPPASTDPFDSDTFILPGDLNDQPTQAPVADPLERFNRDATRLNDKFDEYLAKPVAEFYQDVMPKPLNRMINNFFRNFASMTTVINDVFQGNFYQASADSWRFAINTTVGIGGLFDPATDMGLDYHYTGLGLTFAKWGWTDSSYLVVPLLGPNTVRGFLGDFIDFEYLSFYSYIRPWEAQWGLLVFNLLNNRVQLLEFQNVMDSAALDPYVFTRNAYLQRQAYLIQRNTERDNPNTVEQTRQFNDPYYLYD